VVACLLVKSRAAGNQRITITAIAGFERNARTTESTGFKRVSNKKFVNKRIRSRRRGRHARRRTTAFVLLYFLFVLILAN